MITLIKVNKFLFLLNKKKKGRHRHQVDMASKSEKGMLAEESFMRPKIPMVFLCF